MLTVATKRIGATVALLAVLAGCGSGGEDSTAENPETSIAADMPESFEETATGFVGSSAGGVDVLFTQGAVAQGATIGQASSDGQVLEAGRVFRVGSLSKTFIAVMVLQLVEEVAVDLDAPLGDYLPDTAIGGDATIRQLLSHQSGVPSYTDQPDFFTDILANRSQPITPAEILSYVVDVPTGTSGQFEYSNTNYILLGQLIEQLDGTDLNNALHSRITGPTGLNNTTFDTGEASLPDGLVGGWSSAGDTGDPTAPYEAIASSAWAAGSLLSTVDDLASFLTALAAEDLLTADSLAAMTDTGTTGYGLGLSLVSFSPTQTGYGHSGSILGFTSTMAIDPATGDMLIILTNNEALVADQLAVQILTTG